MPLDIFEETLYGQVLPLEWDKESVSSVAILVDGEEEFVVLPDKNGMKLFEHVDRWVTAEGFVSEEEDEYRIKVRSFKVDDDPVYETDDDW